MLVGERMFTFINGYVWVKVVKIVNKWTRTIAISKNMLSLSWVDSKVIYGVFFYDA